MQQPPLIRPFPKTQSAKPARQSSGLATPRAVTSDIQAAMARVRLAQTKVSVRRERA